MKTWQDYTGNAGTAITTWNYDTYRGWLSAKDYPNSATGAAGTLGPDYTYTTAGRLKTRTWARGIVTTYKYGFDDTPTGNQHGQLTVIDYGDTTPDVTYTYDRRGRRATALANGITATLSYNEADQLTGESWSGGTLNTWNVNPVYDPKLRRSQLRVNKVAALQVQHDYVYDNASRVQQMYQGSYSANYAYEANSSLIDKVDYKFSSTTRLTADRTHDKLNRLTVMVNTPQSGLPVSFAYQYNDANQRIRTVLADGSYWVYEYDEQGQVISGRRFWADHTPVAGQQFDYAFDDIGNRQTTLAGGDQTGGNQRSATYTADRLNRYSSRTVPATFDVLGLATATSAVTVNSQTAYRKGEYFRREVTASNSSAPDWEGVTVSVSGVSSVTGNVWVPQTPESYTYDDDGNTLTDGRWTYTWDAENRLIRLVARTATGPQQRLDFEYDHQGRRIRKTVYSNTAGTPPAATDLKFIYDGWNLIAEVSSADALVRQYMWGTDLSGSIQGAGGVGGLVKIYDHASSKTYFPGYDGNGNIAVLVDGDTGAAGAAYEYGPFGELIRASGTYAATCPFRFSTKYQDKETDLLYYGYRHYNPSTGRFLNRDPLEEQGGMNIMTFVENCPLDKFDVLGRAPFEWILPLYRERMWVEELPNGKALFGTTSWHHFAPKITTYKSLSEPCCYKTLLAGGSAQAIVDWTYRDDRDHETVHVRDHMFPAFAGYKALAGSFGKICWESKAKAECFKSALLGAIRDLYMQQAFRDGSKWDCQEYGNEFPAICGLADRQDEKYKKLQQIVEDEISKCNEE